jgi:hypothetical protein
LMSTLASTKGSMRLCHPRRGAVVHVGHPHAKNLGATCERDLLRLDGTTDEARQPVALEVERVERGGASSGDQSGLAEHVLSDARGHGQLEHGASVAELVWQVLRPQERPRRRPRRLPIRGRPTSKARPTRTRATKRGSSGPTDLTPPPPDAIVDVARASPGRRCSRVRLSLSSPLTR